MEQSSPAGNNGKESAQEVHELRFRQDLDLKGIHTSEYTQGYSCDVGVRVRSDTFQGATLPARAIYISPDGTRCYIQYDMAAYRVAVMNSSLDPRRKKVLMESQSMGKWMSIRDTQPPIRVTIDDGKDAQKKENRRAFKIATAVAAPTLLVITSVAGLFWRHDQKLERDAATMQSDLGLPEVQVICRESLNALQKRGIHLKNGAIVIGESGNEERIAIPQWVTKIQIREIRHENDDVIIIECTGAGKNPGSYFRVEVFEDGRIRETRELQRKRE
jgi:hypothetical protein